MAAHDTGESNPIKYTGFKKSFPPSQTHSHLNYFKLRISRCLSYHLLHDGFMFFMVSWFNIGDGLS